MTKANNTDDRIKARIDESEAQAERSLPATRLPDATPPEKFSGLVGEYPGLAIAAGIGLGLLAGAVLPRGAGRKLARGAIFLASTGGELGMILGKQALQKADDATRESRERLGDTASEAAHKAAEVGRKAADAGRKAGANAQRAAGDASERARDIGLGLAKMALDAASRIRR